MNGPNQPLNATRPLNSSWLLHVVAWLFFGSIFILPPLHPAPGLPAVFGTDLLFPVLCILLLANVAQVRQPVFRPLLIVTAVFSLCISLSIVLNDRAAILRDWFEVYKLVKFAVAVMYVALFIDFRLLDRLVKVMFACMVVFNVLHYFDVLQFNDVIMPLYAGDIQVDTFGINSLGMPDTRRILGTVGNPNNNALLFLFFVVYFARKTYSRMDKALFYTAVFFTLACQSRTGTAALLVVLLVAAAYLKQSLKSVLIDIVVYVAMYLVLLFGGNVYLSSLGDLGHIRNSFEEGRIAMWMKLLHMWRGQPLFGYAPDKEYFYARHWYSEGEYVLMLWRYGAIGFLAYLAWFTTPLVQAWKKRGSGSINVFRLLAFTLVMMIGAVTNNPTLDFSLLMQFSVFFGLFLNTQSEKAAVHE